MVNMEPNGWTSPDSREGLGGVPTQLSAQAVGRSTNGTRVQYPPPPFFFIISPTCHYRAVEDPYGWTGATLLQLSRTRNNSSPSLQKREDKNAIPSPLLRQGWRRVLLDLGRYRTRGVKSTLPFFRILEGSLSQRYRSQ